MWLYVYMYVCFVLKDTVALVRVCFWVEDCDVPVVILFFLIKWRDFFPKDNLFTTWFSNEYAYIR